VRPEPGPFAPLNWMQNLESQRNEDLDFEADESPRNEKRLARGLEDVSYLFLSQTGGEAEKKPNPPPEPTNPQPAPPAPPMILRASSAMNRELLISLLNKNAAVLEDGLRSIDLNIPCDPYGPIDMLLLDGLDQFVIAEIDAAPNDGSFLRGIGHFDWFSRNIPVLRRMYQGRSINFSAPPRLLLIAPAFSQLLKCAARRSASPKICFFEYRAIAIPGGLGLFFEPA
jgi:hypothetical protein